MTDFRTSPETGPERDLVNRLRWPESLPSTLDHPVSVKLRIEAADEIEKLRRNLRHWREECGKLSSFGHAPTPGVRSLEWEAGKGQLDGQLVWSAGDPWLFWIVKNPSDPHYVWCENFNIEGFFPCSPVRGVFDTLDEAKNAAQIDFTKRVLGAIIASPDSSTLLTSDRTSK